ncbi:hypothetical protein RRG08_029867 [Elysia crispata]|uniref:Uncharacterized protein n=1 Tax=Elysia crispata TaxID=231223 RepID=A0AAE0YJM3_9GAST|nr:hypothetical protein RRG08_029867 [Elysia crispata]
MITIISPYLFTIFMALYRLTHLVTIETLDVKVSCCLSVITVGLLGHRLAGVKNLIILHSLLSLQDHVIRLPSRKMGVTVLR